LIAIRNRCRLDWFGAELAGRDLDVLLSDGAHHVARGHAARSDLVRIEPNAHRIVAAAEQPYLADAGNARELVLDPDIGVVAQVKRINLPSEISVINVRKAGDCFCVVTPRLTTSDGRRDSAWETRFCTSTCALFGSVPGAKVIVICSTPSEPATDFMYIIFSTR